jgi:hypothetical protein
LNDERDENADEAQRGRAQFRFGEKCVSSACPLPNLF